MSFIINFGKHSGKTLEWIYFHDPGYIYWMTGNNMQEKLPPMTKERFEDLLRRASYLKIPGMCKWCNQRPITRMFMTLHPSGGLADVAFDCDKCYPLGGSYSVPTYPSFYTPDFFRQYDKTGAYFLVQAIKRVYFGDPSIKMTQKRMEDFFNNPINFVNF
jgi:hypothetical protein